MPDKLTPMSGTTVDKVLAKQQYNIDTVNQNMFLEPSPRGRKVLVAQTALNGVTIQQLWDHVFADNTDFLKRYHDQRNETNLEVGEWHYADDKGNGFRFVSLTTTVDMPRANTKTPLHEAHRFAYVTLDGGKLLLAYQISSQTPSVMSGNTFRVDTYCEITANSADGDCCIAFWGQCKKMSSFLLVPLSVIEPRAMREMTAGYKLMVSMMKKEISKGGGEEAAAATPSPAPAPGEDKSKAAPCETAPAVVVESAPVGGDANATGIAFQGVLMVLALLVAVFVISSTSTVRRTSTEAIQMKRFVRGLEHGGDGWSDTTRSSLSDTIDLDRATGVRAGLPPLTEEQALYKAARDAQINTLRYRWLEQRDAITALEGNVWWMQCAVTLLVLICVGLSVRVFLM